MGERNEGGPIPIDSARKGRIRWPIVNFRMTPDVSNKTEEVMVKKGVDLDYFLNHAALREATIIDLLDKGYRIPILDPQGREVGELDLGNYENMSGSPPQLPPNSIPFPSNHALAKSEDFQPQEPPEEGQRQGIKAWLARLLGR